MIPSAAGEKTEGVQKPSRGADSFPISIKSGGTVVKIYYTPTRSKGKTYDGFTVAYTASGKRQRKLYSDLTQARTAARILAEQKERGELAVAAISAEDRIRLSDALRALEAAPSLGPATFVRLADIVRDYAAAASHLPQGATLVEAAEYFAKRHPANMPQRSVGQVVEELIADRRSAGCSRAHLNDLQDRLGKFAATFQLPISQVSAPLVREYLRNLRGVNGKSLTNRSRRNAQRAITTLFHFARKQKLALREQVDEIAEIEAPKVEAPEVGIFTPVQIRAVLLAAPDDVRAALSIGAFAGLRTAELQRLDWSSVKLAERVIILGADRTKTASRRVVPIADNLAAWLAPVVREAGSVSPSPNERAMNHRFARIAAKQGVTWVRNGLRHSYCSYRLAVTHDPARVATEAGNSASMVHRHYKALVTEAEGKAWFSVAPTAEAATIIAFRQEAEGSPALHNQASEG